MANPFGDIISPDKAFDTAIANGVLSDDKDDANYAGNYMYMYSKANLDFFKNKITRAYVTNERNV